MYKKLTILYTAGHKDLAKNLTTSNFRTIMSVAGSVSSVDGVQEDEVTILRRQNFALHKEIERLRGIIERTVTSHGVALVHE